MRRLLVVTFACYLDDANGAAVATRALVMTLSARGFSVEVLSGPVLALRHEIDLTQWIGSRGSSLTATAEQTDGSSDSRTFPPGVLSFHDHGVPITLLLGSTRPRVPAIEECANFQSLFDEIFARHRPEVVVAYGGGSPILEILGAAKARGAATVFPLHNLGYRDPRTFIDVDQVIVASHYAADFYRATLGIRCVVLPNLVDPTRVLVTERDPRYAVFVNPTAEKGVGVFARIADEIGRIRPDIPFLVVEGTGIEEDVAACGIDLRAHGNTFFHEHTSDPRRFWRLARVCLLPSLIAENQSMVAIEAMTNGIPVLGSNRGGVPETLGAAGIVLPLPDRLSSYPFKLPTAEEVAPWVETILRLWDDPAVYARHSQIASTESGRWSPEVLGSLYDRFFTTIVPGQSS